MNEILVTPVNSAVDISMLLLRIAIGLCFMVHGLGKLGIVGPGNMDGFVSWLKSLGVPFPAIQAKMAMLTELCGGFCLVVGLMTRPAAFFLMGTMIVAMLIGHKGGGYLITNDPPGNEYTINLAVIMVLILLMGPGVYSLDAMFFS